VYGKYRDRGNDDSKKTNRGRAVISPRKFENNVKGGARTDIAAGDERRYRNVSDGDECASNRPCTCGYEGNRPSG